MANCRCEISQADSCAHSQEENRQKLTIFADVLGFSCGRVHIGDTCSRETLLKLVERDGTLAFALDMTCLVVDRRGRSLGDDSVIELVVTTRSEVRWVIVMLMVRCDSQAADSAAVVGGWAIEIYIGTTILGT